MTKHIAGLILFTFIIGTSAAIAGLFDYGSDRSRSFTVRESYRTYKRKKRRKRRCRKHRKPHVFERQSVSVKLTQAVFDRSTGLLATAHAFGNKGYRRGPDAVVYYHFYTNGETGPQYLRTERIRGAFGSSSMESEFSWLADLSSDETIYIIPGYSPNSRSSIVAPRFELSNAVPVLIKETE